jgi:1,2-diacylglycerol 3-alpha-glucosyltransferase
MKIAMFTETWLPIKDGVVNSILSSKEELVKSGNEVYIFAPAEEEKDDFEQGIFYYKAKPVKGYTSYKLALKPTPFYQRTAQLMKELDIELIHSHSPGPLGVRGVAASYRLDLPLVFTYHTYVPDVVRYLPLEEPSQLIIQPIMDHWIRWYLRRCDAIIIPTKSRANELKEQAKLGDIKQMFIVPTGINPSKFSKGDGERIRNALGVEDKRIILYVGRIVKEKNLNLLISAAPLVLKSIPDALFLLVGEGPVRNELQEKVKEKGLTNNFIFTGFVPEEELVDYYHSADAFVFPSTFETQGIVLLEAIASGLPVAAANTSPFPEIIKEGWNGFLFDPFDPKDCARSIGKALKNRELITKNAKETLKEFTTEKCTKKLLEVYYWVLKNRVI